MPLFADTKLTTADNPFLTQRPKAQSAQSLLAASRHEEPAEQSPLDDQTLLGSIGRATLSGLSRVGNALDVVDAVPRNLLAGENPFASFAHPTTDEGRVSGRELLRRHGLIGYTDTYANFFAGLGTELALSPFTYTGIGALTKVGRAAQATGKLTKGLGPSIKAGERSLLSVGLPFTEHATHFGTGAAAQKFAGGIDTALGAVANSAPGRMAQGLFNPEAMGQFGALGQGIAKMTYPARQQAAQKTAEVVNDFLDPIRQTRQAFTEAFGDDIASQAGAAGFKQQVPFPAGGTSLYGAAPEVVAELRKQGYADQAIAAMTAEEARTTANKIRGVFETGARAQRPTGAKISEDLTNHVFERLFGLQAELGGDIDKAMSLFSLDPAKLHPELRAQFVNLANDMQKAAKTINEQALAKGGWGGVLNTAEDFEHFARYAKLGDKDYANAAREFQTIRGSSAHRSDVIGLIPEEIVNRLATDPLARAKNADDAARAMGHIAEKYGDFLGKGTILNEAGEVVPRWAGIGEHAEQLVGWATGHPLRGIFLNPKIEDFARYMKQAHIADSTMDVVHELATRHIGDVGKADLTDIPFMEIPDDVIESIPGGSGVRAFKSKLDSIPVLSNPLGKLSPPKVLLPDYYEKFARMRGKESLEYLATKTGKTVEELRKLAVPHEIALAVQATRNFQDDPRWLGAIGDVLDGFTNFWKQSVTLPFPSFAGRNMASGQYVNASSGLMPTFAHLSSYAQHVKEAFNMLRNGIDPALEKELFTYDVFNPRQLSEGVDGTLYGKYASAQPANPLDWRSTWNEAGQAVDNAVAPGDALNAMAGRSVPFADRLPSMTGARKAAGFVMGTGAKVNQWVEFLNRVPMYRYLRGQGWDAAQAAKKVKELQIDYAKSNYSPFENQIVSRLAPFYKFQRSIAPVILQNLLQRPGGLMGATIRASRLAAGNDPTTPDYIAEGLNIPNPFKTPPAGGSSYLGGFGLPYEQLAQYVASPHVAGRELLSQLNPLIKFPLEAATGQTFFQSGPGGYGRPLEDLDPPIGRTLSNVAGRFASGFDKPVDLPDWFEHMAANSPATRFISTARQLSDPRKTFFDLALSNLTGVRPIDVSPGAKDAVLRDRSVELMKQLGASKFTRTFFKPDDLAAMSPEDRAKAERLMALQTALAGRAKDRVKAKKQLAAQ